MEEGGALRIVRVSECGDSVASVWSGTCAVRGSAQADAGHVDRGPDGPAPWGVSGIRAVAARVPETVATLVDTNVLLDVFTEDPHWADWSAEALASARDEGVLVINPIVYAEVSVRFDGVEELDDALPAADFLREDLPYPAGFLAARRTRETAGRAAPSVRRSPTSTSARTRRSAATAC